MGLKLRPKSSDEPISKYLFRLYLWYLKWVAILAGPFLVLFVIYSLYSASTASPEQKAKLAAERAARQREQALEDAADAARKAEERALQQKAEAEEAAKEARFKCLSPLDGTMRSFAKAVKSELREPDSFEHAGSSATLVGPDGTQRITMKFRARNGFGGVNLELAEAVVRNPECELVSWTFVR